MLASPLLLSLLPALEATQSELIELKNKFDAEAAARWAVGAVAEGVLLDKVIVPIAHGRGCYTG